MANKDANISILAERGVTGNLLAWCQDYLTQRKARVKFQGHISTFLHFENGTPQSGILSPFLFNILIAEVLSSPLPLDVHILAYADDIQIISTGNFRLIHTQQALDSIYPRCKDLGLKINSNKTKALQLRRWIPNQYLYIDTQQIQCVSTYKCLGEVFNSQGDSSAQLRHVLQKTKSRINVLCRRSATEMGAGFHVLRTFYIQGIRSIIDYSATSLKALTPVQLMKLETVQNKCMSHPWSTKMNLSRKSMSGN